MEINEKTEIQNPAEMTPNTFAENINAAENKTYADDKNLNVEITNGITFDVSKLFDALEIFDVSDKIIADYKKKTP